jgi:hypothetical protein
MNKRKMIVTVGTSLLSSASWRPDGESNPFSSITAYPQWAATNARGRRSFPPADTRVPKAATRQSIIDAIGERIKAPRAHEFVDWQKDWFTDTEYLQRHSAELATIAKMFRRLAPDQRLSPAEWLSESYDSLVFLCSPSDRDPAKLCARHLAAALSHLGAPAIVTEALAGLDLPVKAKNFARYLRSIPSPDIDLVASGGYKVYFGVASNLLHLQPSWRLFYTHEDEDAASELITERALPGRRELEADRSKDSYDDEPMAGEQ